MVERFRSEARRPDLVRRLPVSKVSELEGGVGQILEKAGSRGELKDRGNNPVIIIPKKNNI